MLGGAKEAMAKRMASEITPSETPIGRALVDRLARLEHQQARAVDRALDAADLDVDVEHDLDKRRQDLLSLADAIVDGDRAGWWWENIAPELMDNPDEARQYVGLTSIEWYDLIRSWHDQYHDQGLVDEPADEADPAAIGATADKHVRARFDLSLREFVASVINWSEARATEQALAGPIGRNTQAMHVLADELEKNDE